MSIFEDFFMDINVKPSKSKLVIKWIVRISVLLILGAFIVGQFKSSHISDLNEIKEGVAKNGEEILQLKDEMNVNLLNVNNRIDKVYDDGYRVFMDYQEFNNRQFELIIDYGQTNKELLKEMINVNSIERENKISGQLEQSKNGLSYKNNLPVETKREWIESIDYQRFLVVIDVNTRDSIFNYFGATMEFIGGIDRDKYRIIGLKNSKYVDLFDVKYISVK